MILSGHQPNYLPYPGLFAKIYYSDCFIYVTKVQLERKSWQTRNKIINSNKYLTLPIIHNGLNETINNIKLDNTKTWKDKHFNSIFFTYKKSPFFKKYIVFFEELYSKNWLSLSKLNIFITNFILKELNISTKIFYDEDFIFYKKNYDLLIEMTNKLNCKGYLSNKGSQSYVNLDIFKQNNISHFFCDYNSPKYFQGSKKNKFQTNLTIFDMLFFCGKSATEEIIKNPHSLIISDNWKTL